MDGKVFCIGLARTGTHSLTEALNMLGIPTIHYPKDESTFLHLSNGFYRLPVLETYQAITDIVVAPYYAQFDREYPGSKFILTVREKNSWLESVEANLCGTPEKPVRNDDIAEIRKFFRASCYGSYRFSRERFSYVYDLHVRNVKDYFRERPGDLLVADLCGGEGWDALCAFLGKPVPKEPFPHRHTRRSRSRGCEEQDGARGLLGRMARWVGRR
jgi:hypothetical protein